MKCEATLISDTTISEAVAREKDRCSISLIAIQDVVTRRLKDIGYDQRASNWELRQVHWEVSVSNKT